MKISKNFSLVELVGPSVYNYMGDHSAKFLNPQMVKFNQALRDKFGPSIVNNWASGGNFKESGHRLWDTKTGAKGSAHKFGMATDNKYRDATPDEVRAHILANQAYWLEQGLTRIEDGAYAPTWVHADCIYTGVDYIVVIKP